MNKSAHRREIKKLIHKAQRERKNSGTAALPYYYSKMLDIPVSPKEWGTDLETMFDD